MLYWNFGEEGKRRKLEREFNKDDDESQDKEDII